MSGTALHGTRIYVGFSLSSFRFQMTKHLFVGRCSFVASSVFYFTDLR